MATKCWFSEYVCHKCNKKGHLARVCHFQKYASRNGKMSGAGAQTHQLTSADPGSEEEQALYRLEQHKVSPIMVNVQGQWSASIHGAGHRSSSISDVTAAVEGTVPHGSAPAIQGHPTHVHSTESWRGGNLASQGSVRGAGEGLNCLCSLCRVRGLRCLDGIGLPA